MSDYENLSLVIENLDNLMEELFTSGFNVVHEGTLSNLKESIEECERYGLLYAYKSLDRIYKGLEEKRHNLHYDMNCIIKEYCALNKYILIIKNKLQLEIIKEEMEKGVTNID